MTRLKSTHFIFLGVALIVGGFAYDIIFAGIPYQDPTPEMADKWQFHSDIAGTIRRVGTVVLVCGGLWAAFAVRQRRTQ